MAEEPVLQCRGIVKRFPGMVALDHVDFTLFRGEVHGLMGENGAGKSTLLKIVTGAQARDEGQILLEGKLISPDSPQSAAALGINCVYQEVNLAPNLTVAENLFLGSAGSKSWRVPWKQMNKQAEEVLEKLGIKVDVTRPLNEYSIAIQQLVAISRAVVKAPLVLVLDEPTSSLDVGEVDRVFEVIRKLRSEGIGIVFVSHFLGQVYDICDRLTVLRNGQVVGTRATAEIDKQELVSLMVGHEVGAATGASSDRGVMASEPVLKSVDLGKRNSVQGVSIEAGKGEIFGLAGLLGSGRTETLDLLFGAAKRDKGSLSIKGAEFGIWNCRKAIRRGLGYVPEDRKTLGIIPGLGVRENILLALHARQGLGGRLAMKKQRELVDEMVRALNIRTTDIEKPIEFLSGGNQQKCMLARWLVMNPEILLLDEPTRGIDVGAKEEILKVLQTLSGQGTTLVVADSELLELVSIAHRIAVLRDRAMVCTLEGADVNQETVVARMAKGEAS